MASKDATDLMMMFVINGSEKLRGEARSDFIKSFNMDNPLTKGFKQGYFFEVDNFTFRAGTSGQEEEEPPATTKKSPRDKNSKNAERSMRGGDYRSFKEGRGYNYPAEFQPVTFRRPIDIGSPILMQKCIERESFERATIIKRKATGSGNAGEVFLRIDFVGVLITSIGWSEEDEVQEEVEFVCRSVTIAYKPQLPDGTLGATIPGFWTMTTTEKPFDVRSAS